MKNVMEKSKNELTLTLSTSKIARWTKGAPTVMGKVDANMESGAEKCIKSR